MKVVTVLRGAAVARVGVGMALALATRPVLRSMVRSEEPSASLVLFARTVGIRDACFGLALLRASATGTEPGEARRLIRAWLANEVADVVAAVAGSRKLGASGAAAAAAAPLPLIAADLWILRRLP
jgi:hypothetical protein